MRFKTVLSVLSLGALVPILLAATAPSDPTVQPVTNVDASGKASDFIGSWSCEASKAEELPGGQGKLVMTQIDNITWKAKDKVESKGEMSLKVMTTNAKWDTKMQGDWRVKEGELCVTVGTAKITPANDDARKFEEQMGRSMQDAIPTGQENCEEIVEVSRKGYVTKDAKAGVLTRCKRK